MTTPISSYVQYLPAVYWSRDNDTAQFLGRSLRIFEKILTGLPIDARAVRAHAPFTTADNDRVRLGIADHGRRFRADDWITIDGSAEREQIDHIANGELVLKANLNAGPYVVGTVRIADLTPGQTSFRVDNESMLGPGTVVELRQGITTETATVAAYDRQFVTLSYGLVNTYAMAAASLPVELSDGIPLLHSGREYDDLESTIDHLYELFSPWRTRSDFLPWLASWLALPLHPEWDEYQKRKLIAEIVDVYQHRGLKTGLHTYLDIWAVSPAQPRIAIDDGDAVFRWHPDDPTELHSIAHSNTIATSGGALTMLLHPTAIAIDGMNALIVADEGDMSLTIPRPPAIWRMSSWGETEFNVTGGMPAPTPIHSGAPLERPAAIVVDSLDRFAVVDIGTVTGAASVDSGIFRFDPPGYALTTVIDQTTAPTFPAIRPVDMIINSAGDFVVLDRGNHPLGSPPAGAAVPKLVIVSEGPLSVATQALLTITEPTAMVEIGGRFIIADAQDQAGAVPADLIEVDPANGFAETSLLSMIPAADNPLIFPTGLAQESPTSILVCDMGVRWGFIPPGSSNRSMAEPAALYRIDLSTGVPTITRLASGKQMVQPTKICRDRRGGAVISDRGETQNTAPQRSWRAGANELGVVVLFSQQRPTTNDERNLIRRGITSVINEQKPGHTAWWMDS